MKKPWEIPVLSEGNTSGVSRRSFIKTATVAGALTMLPVSLLSQPTTAAGDDDDDHADGGLRPGDRDILIAAEIAEALAVTTYSNIINTAPFFKNLQSDDQGYLEAALNEEMSHYLLEQSVTSQPSPFSTFFYPQHMFDDAQTTQHAGHARRRLHRRVSCGSAQVLDRQPSRHRGAHHGHRE